MAITRRPLIFITVLFSCASAALLLVSLFTTSWVSGTVVPTGVSGASPSPINYGLYAGFISRTLSSSQNANDLDLYISCLMGDNVCAWSCISDADIRTEELENLYNDGNLLYEYPTVCSSDNRTVETNLETPDKKFMNAGIWISTMLFLGLSILFAIWTAALGVVNSVSNPINDAFSIRGLYIYHGIAAVCCLLVLVLWGAQFGSTLIDNVVYTEVISGHFRNTSVSLGYSYWLVIPSFAFNLLSIGALYGRQYLISHDTPPETPVKVDNEDGRIFLY